MKVVCTIIFLLCVGCASSASDGGARDAVKAKDALLQLMRANSNPFEGADAARFEKVPLQCRGNGQYDWGAFVIDVNKKTYSVVVVSEDSALFYSGRFVVDSSGRWKAENLQKVYADK